MTRQKEGMTRQEPGMTRPEQGMTGAETRHDEIGAKHDADHPKLLIIRDLHPPLKDQESASAGMVFTHVAIVCRQMNRLKYAFSSKKAKKRLPATVWRIFVAGRTHFAVSRENAIFVHV